MKNKILIVDTKSKAHKLPKFLKNFLFKNYVNTGMVQFMKIGNKDVLTICGDSVKWLETFSIKSTSEKRADKICFDWLNNKYPEYKGYIQLF